jgi:hypothetical protein
VALGVEEPKVGTPSAEGLGVDEMGFEEVGCEEGEVSGGIGRPWVSHRRNRQKGAEYTVLVDCACVTATLLNDC